MRVPSLLAYVLAATAAMATAGGTPRESIDQRVPYTNHPEHYRPPTIHYDWVRLGTPTPTRWGTEYFVIDPSVGPIRTLRFEVMSGTVMLRRVQVMRGPFRHTVQVQTRLDRWHPVAYVDLGTPQYIQQLAVTTDRWPRGSYVVHGSYGRVERVQVVSER